MGDSLKQRGINCDGRRSPFTFLLVHLGHTGLMYGGDAAFFNNRESRGVLLFDTDTPHTSIIEVDVGWKAEYRSALLKICS